MLRHVIIAEHVANLTRVHVLMDGRGPHVIYVSFIHKNTMFPNNIKKKYGSKNIQFSKKLSNQFLNFPFFSNSQFYFKVTPPPSIGFFLKKLK